MALWYILGGLFVVAALYVNLMCIRAGAWWTLIFIDVIVYFQLKVVLGIIGLPVDF